MSGLGRSEQDSAKRRASGVERPASALTSWEIAMSQGKYHYLTKQLPFPRRFEIVFNIFLLVLVID